MTREQAINYLISSGFTDEQVSEVVRALTYEPTTKNDLGVDCIDRQAVLDLIADYDLSMGQVVKGIHALPPVTPQEPQSFKWCTDCKEYDQEKHCCHRCSKVIRDTVEEMKQEPKTGHWIWQTEDIYRCSECGNDIRVKEVMNIPQYVRCPMCEAKMIEPQESEDN